jgi:hypothetical protein
MTWQEDKKAILSKMVQIYQGIEKAPNRYEAGILVFAEFDYFVGCFFSDDRTVTAMLQVDGEFANAYLETMSELIGEEI